jgi:hypothetical protein
VVLGRGQGVLRKWGAAAAPARRFQAPKPYK